MASGVTLLGSTTGTTTLKAGAAGNVVTSDGANWRSQPSTGGAGTVTSVGTGTGLTGGPITATGTIDLANTAVTPATYINATVTVDQQGRITSAANGSGGTGTVTSITAGTGMSFSVSPITTSGTINLANTVVTPASYTLANITVDPQGRLTAAASGTVNLATQVSSTLPVANGGTGIASYAAGDIVRATGATTLTKLNLGAAGNTLKVKAGGTDIQWAAGGSVESFQTEIDFGATPLSSQTFTIVNAAVTASSKIVAALAYLAPTGKDLDECEMDNLSIICGASSGSFDMFVNAVDSSYLAGAFKINYTVG